MQRTTFDKERVSLDIARLKKGGNTFEVVVNPDLAIEFKNGSKAEINDVLVDPKIFCDAKKGMLASESEIKSVFGTTDAAKVAETILKDGDVHLTAAYKSKIMEEKKKKIIAIIHVNGIDPRTGLPHPETRVQNAFEQAKVKLSEFKSAEDQVQDVLKALKPILPIRFEVKQVEIKLPAKYAGSFHSMVKGFGKILRQNWQSDGSLDAVIEIPAGLEPEFYDKINSFTHGSAQATVLKQK